VETSLVLMTRTSNQIGDDAEARAMAILQGRRVGGSGGGRFLKGDGSDGGNFVYFVKATATVRTTSARAIRKLWNEALAGARGPAGHGDGSKPALIFELEGELFLLCRLEDHAELATATVTPYIEPSKVQERRARHLRRPSER
jgi:hypothetical protein